MAKSKHKSDANFLKKHKRTGGIDGGACLNRHIAGVTQSSCSHRWQAYKKAEENKDWYDWKAYESLAWTGRPRDVLTAVKGHFLGRLWLPNPREWDLDQTTFGVPNFQKSSKLPYWHQAHHIIPNGVLNGCILQVSEEADSRSLFFLIRSGLLNAEYNLNHKVNMVLLPMGKEVAKALKLPRHIAGIEAEPGVAPEKVKHEAYSKNVEKRVIQIISKYAEQLDEGEHDEEADALSKQELNTHSEKIFKKIRTWGLQAAGKAVDSMPDAEF